MENILSILIVDDEESILNIYKTKFVQSGFRVFTASDGLAGIEMAKREKPNLILMDIKMPGIDGVTAAMKLKDSSETKDIKVVFLSAFSDPVNPEVDAKLAREIGAIDFIKKGINLNELVEKVKVYLSS